MVKEHCDLCGINMELDDNVSNQYVFMFDNIVRNYCSKLCGKRKILIFQEVIKRSNINKHYKEYYGSYELIKIVEAIYKNKNGNYNIMFDNNLNYDESVINAPILRDGKPIGIITNITDKTVYGLIWGRYMPI